jgi:hypothetical protein
MLKKYTSFIFFVCAYISQNNYIPNNFLSIFDLIRIQLHIWHVEKTTAHPYFERISDDLIKDAPEVRAMLDETEESKKVARMGGKKFFAVFRRKNDFELPKPAIFSLFASASS